MSAPGIRVLSQEAPVRSIALATQSHALVLKSNSTNSQNLNGSNSSSRNPSAVSLHESGSTSASALCIAEFGTVEEVSVDSWKSLSYREVFGTLGLIAINNDIFLCVVNSATKAAEARPGETVQKINSVEFRKLYYHSHDGQLLIGKTRLSDKLSL